jgi:hypothetical protein
MIQHGTFHSCDASTLTMKSFNKRQRFSPEDQRFACEEEPMGGSGSKRTRRNQKPPQEVGVNVVLDDHEVPPTEEASSLSSSSRSSSGESLNTLSYLGAAETGKCNLRKESLQSPPTSTSVVLEFSRVHREERRKAMPTRAAIERKEAPFHEVEPIVEESLCQGNHVNVVIAQAPLKESEDPTKKKPWSCWRSWVLGLILVICGVRQYSPQREHHMIVSNETAIPFHSTSAPRTVYVPGYGFSGFWYILGRLQSIPEPHIGNEFYCYSAGCMGVVATLQNMSMVDIHEEAVRIQNQWKAGEISRYEVVEHFVSWLLLPSADDSATTRNMLSSLKIITSAPGQSWAVQPVVRSPSSIRELREMLIQTTWIPFATGGAVWHSAGHNDGAFTWPFHPTCDVAIGLTGTNFMSSLDLLLNVVNVNLSGRKVEEFWNLGVANNLA